LIATSEKIKVVTFKNDFLSHEVWYAHEDDKWMTSGVTGKETYVIS